MTPPVFDPKADLRRYLDVGHVSIVWKLDGASEYDIRRPLVPSGTNLLGLVKHLASIESEYLGLVFGRPFPETLPWLGDDHDDDDDMWATPEQSRDDVVGLYRRVWEHSFATIDALELDAVGEVPWWPADRRRVTLHEVLTHLVCETFRHAGHVDILRETLDGAIGLREGNDNLPDRDAAAWSAFHSKVQAAADPFRP